MKSGDRLTKAREVNESVCQWEQVHATLAVAEQLARVAEALDMLTQLQQDDG